MRRNAVGLALPVDDIRRMLGGKVLPKCTAKKRIDELKSTADAENGFIGLQRLRQQQRLQLVAFRTGNDGSSGILHPIKLRRDILTARKQKSIAGFHNAVSVFI